MDRSKRSLPTKSWSSGPSKRQRCSEPGATTVTASPPLSSSADDYPLSPNLSHEGGYDFSLAGVGGQAFEPDHGHGPIPDHGVGYALGYAAHGHAAAPPSMYAVTHDHGVIQHAGGGYGNALGYPPAYYAFSRDPTSMVVAPSGNAQRVDDNLVATSFHDRPVRRPVKLSKEEIAGILNVKGVNEVKWAENFVALYDFFVANKGDHPKRKKKGEEGKMIMTRFGFYLDIGEWVHTQRSNKNISIDRVQLLNRIGFDWVA